MEVWLLHLITKFLSSESDAISFVLLSDILIEYMIRGSISEFKPGTDVLAVARVIYGLVGT